MSRFDSPIFITHETARRAALEAAIPAAIDRALDAQSLLASLPADADPAVVAAAEADYASAWDAYDAALCELKGWARA